MQEASSSSSSASPISSSNSPGVSSVAGDFTPFVVPPENTAEDAVFMMEGVEEPSPFGHDTSFEAETPEKKENNIEQSSPYKSEPKMQLFKEELKRENPVEPMETSPEASPRKPPSGTPKRKYRSDPYSPIRYQLAVDSEKLHQKCVVEVESISEKMLAGLGLKTDLTAIFNHVKEEEEEEERMSPFEQADDFAEMRLAYSAETESEGSVNDSPVKRLQDTVPVKPVSALNLNGPQNALTTNVIAKDSVVVKSDSDSSAIVPKVNETNSDALIKPSNNNELGTPTAMVELETDSTKQENTDSYQELNARDISVSEPTTTTSSSSSSNAQSDSRSAVISTPNTGVTHSDKDNVPVSLSLSTATPTDSNSNIAAGSNMIVNENLSAEPIAKDSELVSIQNSPVSVSKAETITNINANPPDNATCTKDSAPGNAELANTNANPPDNATKDSAHENAELACAVQKSPEAESTALDSSDPTSPTVVLAEVESPNTTATSVTDDKSANQSFASNQDSQPEKQQASPPIIVSRQPLSKYAVDASQLDVSTSAMNSPSPTNFVKRECDIFGHIHDCKCENPRQYLNDLPRNFSFERENAVRRPYQAREEALTMTQLQTRLVDIDKEEEEKLKEEKPSEEKKSEPEPPEESTPSPTANLQPLPQNMFPGVEILENRHDEPTPVALVTATEEELNNFISESLGADQNVPQVAQQEVVTCTSSTVPNPLEQGIPSAMVLEQNVQQSLPPDPETESACVVLMEQEATASGLDDTTGTAMEVVIDDTQSTQDTQLSEIAAVDEGIIPPGSTYYQAEDGLHVILPDGKEIIYTPFDTPEGTVLAATEVPPQTADPNFLSPTTVDHMLTEEVVETDQLPNAEPNGSLMTQLGDFSAELESVIMGVMQSGSSAQDASLGSKLSAIESIIPEDQLEANINAIRQASVNNPPCAGTLPSESTPAYKEYLHNTANQNGKKKPAPRRRRSSTKTGANRGQGSAKRRANSVGSGDPLAAAMNQSGM